MFAHSLSVEHSSTYTQKKASQRFDLQSEVNAHATRRLGEKHIILIC